MVLIQIRNLFRSAFLSSLDYLKLIVSTWYKHTICNVEKIVVKETHKTI